jgi:hypothetical protein
MLTEQLAAVTALELAPDEKLRRMIRAYLAALTDNIDLASVLLMEHRSLEPRLHARHVPNRDRFERLWLEAIQQGVGAGVFACSDASLTVRALMGIMNWTITWYRPGGPKSIDQISDEYAALLFNGLLAVKKQGEERRDVLI